MPLESFRGFNFRGIGPFCCMHACNIKFAVLMFAVHANPRKPRTFIPSKYTRYTVHGKSASEQVYYGT